MKLRIKILLGSLILLAVLAAAAIHFVRLEEGTAAGAGAALVRPDARAARAARAAPVQVELVAR